MPPVGRRTRAQAHLTAVPDGQLNILPIEAGDLVRMFLYSYPGWGKTSLLSTGAAKYKTLIIHSSMDLIPRRALASGAHHIIADTHETMLEILEHARMDPAFDYEWVWWDCVSIAQDVLLDDVWEASWRNKPGRNWILDAAGKPTTKPNISPTGGKDKPEYGTNADRIQMWVRHMVGCKRFNFGMTAHPVEGPHPTNDEGGDVLRPYVQVKQMTEKLCGYCNMVGFLEVLDEEKDGNTPRRLHFKENSRFYAKDLYDAFLPEGYLDEPTMPKIMDAIERAKKSGMTAPTQTAGRGRRGATRR